MTRKRAIKIAMSVTHCGNKRWVDDAFNTINKHMTKNASNADVCLRLLCHLCNRGTEVGASATALGAYQWSCVLIKHYGAKADTTPGTKKEAAAGD